MDTVPRLYPESDDTYLLIDSLLQDVSSQSFNERKCILSVEIGPGGGSVSEAFLQHCSKIGLTVFHLAVDVNTNAASETLSLCETHGALDCVNAESFSFFRPSFRADIIFCNPPYVPSSPVNRARDIRASYAGGERGREMIDALLPAVKKNLNPEGLFYLLLEARNDVAEVLALAESQYGFKSRFVREKRIRGEHLFVYCFTNVFVSD